MENAECEMDAPSPRDIHERTLEYGLRAIRLFRYLQASHDDVALIVGRQLLRAATSVGANMAEADAAETRADFVHKCAVAQKEARECLYWMRLIQRAELVPTERLGELASETEEILKVIATISRNARRHGE